MRTCVVILLMAACSGPSLSIGSNQRGPDLADVNLPCAATCTSGCCDANGNCRSGLDDYACGSAGAFCAGCIDSSCVALSSGGGECVAPDGGTCNPGTCPNGCCLGSQCIFYYTEQACGGGGEKCAVCPPGYFCKGACFQILDSCGPSNCPGCCNGNWCSTGTDSASCGRDGLQCFDCRPGPACQPSGTGGLCGGKPPCLNCNGCCLDGKCVPGDSDDQCGGNGTTCQSCASQGTHCMPNGNGDRVCGTSFLCSTQSCSGCCYGSICAVGNQDFACGTNGGTCISCEDRQQKCKAGACY